MSLQEVCPVCQCGKESCENCTKESDNCNSIDSCCCADNEHVLWHKQEIRKGLYLEYFSLGWMSIEVIASIIAGLVIGKSFALLSFAGDSIVELISAYAVLNYLRNVTKGKFAESESERTERIALLLLITLIPVIALGAIYSYVSGIKPEASLLGIAVAIGVCGDHADSVDPKENSWKRRQPSSAYNRCSRISHLFFHVYCSPGRTRSQLRFWNLLGRLRS